VRAASFTLAYEIFDETSEGRRVYLRARSVLTPYAFAAEHPRRLTTAERDVLEAFVEPDVPPLPAQVVLGEPAGARHAYESVVRFSDVDAYRHVNNVKYFEYYQEARIAMINALGGLPDESSDGAGLGVVVAHVDVDYRSPLFFREQPYVVETWVSGVGGSSFVIDGQILDGERVVSAAHVVMVAFDPATQRPRRLDERQRSALIGQ
jgi:acyl-CoA thioester hydrolase